MRRERPGLFQPISKDESSLGDIPGYDRSDLLVEPLFELVDTNATDQAFLHDILQQNAPISEPESILIALHEIPHEASRCER